MTTASALYEVFKTLPPSSKREFVALLNQEDSKNTFMESLERGLKEVKAIEAGEKKGKTLKQILDGE